MPLERPIERRTERVGSAWPVRGVIAGALAVGALVGALWIRHAVSDEEARREIAIAAGLESGTYNLLGTALARLLESEGVVDRARVVVTGGSVENMERLEAAEAAASAAADIAFVQSDTRTGPRARLVATLYDEVLHILVRAELADEIKTIHDLTGRRVAVGAPGSGTQQVVDRVLAHFDVEPAERIERATSAEGLGDLDAAFALTAVSTPWLDRLVRAGGVRFLSLGEVSEEGSEADAFALMNPSFSSVVVPREVYGSLPARPLRSIAVSALLVARSDLEAELVRDITRELFAHRLADEAGGEGVAAVATRIREDYRPADAVIAYHPGAIAYYQREAPPFFVQYAEAISLGLTILVGLYSGYVALAGWMRRREKNRLDAYLIEAERSVADLSELPLEELIARRDALDDVRHRSFADFVAERLPANEAFTILQDFLRSERASLESRIREKSG